MVTPGQGKNAGSSKQVSPCPLQCSNMRRSPPDSASGWVDVSDAVSDAPTDQSDVSTDVETAIRQEQSIVPSTAGNVRRALQAEADTKNQSDVDTDSDTRICKKQCLAPSAAGNVTHTTSRLSVDAGLDAESISQSDVETDCNSESALREQRRTQPCQAKKEATLLCAQLRQLPPDKTSGGRCLQTNRAKLILDLITRCGRGTKGKCWRPDCRANCKSQICARVSDIADFLLPAYNCTLVAQDMVFSELLQPTAGFHGDRGQVAYAIAGTRVCRLALERLLGIGRARAKRVKKGLQDGRRLKRPAAKFRRGEAWSEIYGHLWRVYESVAEMRADESVVIVDRNNPTAELEPEHRRAAETFKCELGRERCFGAAGSRLLSTDGLPRKYLPPGCPKDHWWTFLSTPGYERFAKSYGRFKAVWKECFQDILSFNTFDTHSQCSTCSELKAAIRSAPDMATKTRQAEFYNQHLQRQWRDRLIYWRVRALSREKDGGWLCIMIDGADQAKFRVLKAQRWPSDFDGVHRPKVQVVGCLAHGYECSFNIREEDVGKGSEFTLEVLTRCLERVFAKCDAEGTCRPVHLWLQSDNTSGENKNQWIQRYLATLVDRAIFRSAVDAYLIKGHTHEDLDGHFGVMSGHIAGQMDWDTPQEMAGHIQRRMARHLHPLHVSAGTIGDVRNWKEWLAPLGDIPTVGGIAGITGKAASHYWHYCRRCDLPAEVAGNVRAPQDSVDPNDVVVMEKEFMSSKDLRQHVITFCQPGASWLLPTSPATWKPRDKFQPAFVKDLDNMAELVMRHFPEKAAAVNYLQAWLSRPRLPVGPPPALALFSRQQRRQTPRHSAAVGPALHAVTSAGSGQVQCMSLKRRRAASKAGTFASRITSVSLQTWVDFRESQGKSADEAVLEWRGAQQRLHPL